MATPKKIVVKQDVDADEVPVEILANEITAMAESVRRLRAGRLNERALILLIQNAAPGIKKRMGNVPISSKQVRAVLDGIDSLEREYLRPAKKP